MKVKYAIPNSALFQSKFCHFCLASVLFLLSGCATFTQQYVNAEGDSRFCESTGTGLIGMAAAASSTAGCGESFRALGYYPIDQAGAVGIKFRGKVTDTSLIVLSVIPGSPADKMGIKPGHRIYAVDGQMVTDKYDALVLMFGEWGRFVNITYWNGTDTATVRVMRAQYKSVYGIR